jgi:hypothetical protein
MPYFIDDIIFFETENKLKFTNNLHLRIATEEERTTIKFLLKKFGRFSDNLSFDYHEYKSSNAPRFDGRLEERAENDKRYCVVEDGNSSEHDPIIPNAFLLAEQNFFSPFHFKNTENGGPWWKYSFGELSTFSYYNDINMVFGKNESFLMKGFEEKDRLQVDKIITLLNHWNIRKDKFPIITKALNDFFKLSEISDKSVFKIISYFACLEMLVVNNGVENIKPIKIQLENKLNLLNNRFKIPIEISRYIKGPDTLNLGNVLKVIYTYRSTIAHGDFIDFCKKLKIIEKTSTEQILNLLRITLKKVILFSLEEPELIRDLKKC